MDDACGSDRCRLGTRSSSFGTGLSFTPRVARVPLTDFLETVDAGAGNRTSSRLTDAKAQADHAELRPKIAFVSMLLHLMTKKQIFALADSTSINMRDHPTW